MEQHAPPTTKRPIKDHIVQLRFVDREGDQALFRAPDNARKTILARPIEPAMPVVGSPPFHNPVQISGTFDFAGALPQVSLTSYATGKCYTPLNQVIPPPGGMDWSFLFDVLPLGDYVLKDLEGSTTNVIDPFTIS
jgi:hypothetical protein